LQETPFYIIYARFALVYLFVFQIVNNFLITDIPSTILLFLLSPVNSIGFFLFSLICTFSLKLIPKDVICVLLFSLYVTLVSLVTCWFMNYEHRLVIMYVEIGFNFYTYYFVGRALFLEERWADKNLSFLTSLIKPVSILVVTLMIMKGNIAAMLGFGQLDEQASYLAVSDLYLLFSSLGILYFFKQKKFFWLLFIILIQAFMYSRTSFVCLFVASAAYIIWLLAWSKPRLLFLIAASGFALALLFMLFQDPIVETMRSYRHLGWLVDRTLTTSLTSRNELMDIGLLNISNNPFLGQVLWQYEYFSHTGKYIHNAMSYWSQYGFVAFIFVCMMAIWSSNIILFSSCSRLQMLGIPLFSFLIEIIVSRAFVYPYVWLLFGLVIGLSKISLKKGQLYENL
jgi:hypothetical protein